MPRPRMQGRQGKKKVAVQTWERLELVEKDLRELALKLHQHLARAKIYAVGKPRGSRAMCCGGVAKLVKVSKAVRALVRQDLGDAHYLAVLGLDKWQILAPEARKRVLDHLLCHAVGREGDGDDWTLVDHDVAEFTAIIKRHGFDDSPGLTAFVQAAKQLTLAET